MNGDASSRYHDSSAADRADKLPIPVAAVLVNGQEARTRVARRRSASARPLMAARAASPTSSSVNAPRSAAASAAMAEQKRVAFLITGTQGDHDPSPPLAKALSAKNVEVFAWTVGREDASPSSRGLGVDAKLLDGTRGPEMMTTIPEVMDAMATGERGRV